MKSNKKILNRQQKDTLFIISFLAIPVFLLLVFLYYPSIDGIIMSFQDVKAYDMYSQKFCGFDNYQKLFSSSLTGVLWKNTFLWLFICVSAEFVMGFGLALLLQSDFPGRKLYEAVVFVPWALSGFVVGVIWKWMFNGSTGVINDILIRFGILEKQMGFLSNPDLAIYCVIIAKVWTGMAFFSIVTMAALRTVPKDMYEAADIDGANGVQKFFYITIPSIKTLLLLTIMMRSIAMMNAPDLIFGMTAGGPAGRSHTISSYIMTEVVHGTDYGLISATSVILWILTLVFAVIYLITTKATKGSDD